VSEESTQNLTSGRSFEERVFARFDAVDSAIRDLDGRVQNLEIRSYDTKPIWERALNEILETRRELGETRSEVVEVRRELGETRSEVVEVRRELGETRRNLSKRVDRFLAIAAETREDFQDMLDRLEKVESKQI
jgi:uncharacterized coiled-coil DUF342 family protein